MTGQISRGKPLGDWIFNTTKLPDTKIIVELGTGSGLGSTKCVTDALDETKTFYTVEANKEHYDLAVSNVPKQPNIHVIFGHITTEMIDYTTMPGTLFKGYNHTQCAKWLERDKEDYKNCPNVLHMLPTHIDLLILDSGAFTGYAEFMLLKDRCGHIVLDDTVDIKNYDARQVVLTNYAEYEIIMDKPNERNGYLIVRRCF